MKLVLFDDDGEDLAEWNGIEILNLNSLMRSIKLEIDSYYEGGRPTPRSQVRQFLEHKTEHKGGERHSECPLCKGEQKREEEGNR